jgi:DNA primase
MDFRDLRDRFTIEQVAKDLGLTPKPEGRQFRASCPKCKPDDPRAIVITPSTGGRPDLFYCFTSAEGGDVLNFVAHIRSLTIKQAAQFLSQEPESAPQLAHGMEALSHLDYEHSKVQDLGFTPEVAKKLGIGFAKKGVMRNYVAVPIRFPDGTLIGYIGVTDAKVPKGWRM